MIVNFSAELCEILLTMNIRVNVDRIPGEYYHMFALKSARVSQPDLLTKAGKLLTKRFVCFVAPLWVDMQETARSAGFLCVRSANLRGVRPFRNGERKTNRQR